MSIIPLIACAYPAPFLTMATILLMVFVSALHAMTICCCVFSSSKQTLVHRYPVVAGTVPSSAFTSKK